MHTKRDVVLAIIFCLVVVGTSGVSALGQSVESSSTYAIPSATTAATPIQFPSLQANSELPLTEEQPSDGFASPTITVVSSLAVVLGLFAGLVWLTRRYGGGSVRAGSVPNDVIQNLGSTVLDARTRVTMLRCGNRIVVAAQTASGVHPLCEITDPREVIELTAACMGQTPPEVGETTTSTPTRDERTRGRLFASA